MFRHCRDQDVHWVTYRRGAALKAMYQSHHGTMPAAARGDLAEETITITDYGPARHSPLRTRQVVLQVLTCDFDGPAGLLAWLSCRWREENVFNTPPTTTASTGYATTSPHRANARSYNPARKVAAPHTRGGKTLAQAHTTSRSCWPPSEPRRQVTTPIPAAEKRSPRAGGNPSPAATHDRSPRRSPLTCSTRTPNALLRTHRRSLQMVLRLLALNAEHWLSNHLNAYLSDNDEYRAITRETIIRGLAGTITYTPGAITVRLDPPRAPRIARALTLLIDEINHTPPAMPGDRRPITYHLTANPGL